MIRFFARFLGCVVIITGLCAGCTVSNQASGGYGVFIGVDPENSAVFGDYETVVIDAEYYSDTEMSSLKQNGHKVYSYLNIGSIETFRDAYANFKNDTLGRYENWPDEYWMDVSSAAWQEYISNAAEALAGKGIDGFFLDNTDVYYLYNESSIFNGLVDIINGLKRFEKDILINGGDAFVKEAILTGGEPLVRITGINQECVFTRIDFENDKFLDQLPEDKTYFQEYLDESAAAGLRVYITEYAEKKNSALRREIEDYCARKDYTVFIASSINLDGA